MQSEHSLQVALLQWLQLQHKEVFEVTYATPNAGKRSYVQGKRMKAEGLKAGVPDLCLAYPVEPYHGLYIELKTEKGRATDHQKQWLDKLNAQGYKALLCKGFDEARTAIQDYLSAA